MPTITGLVFALPKQVRKELFERFAGARSPGYKDIEKWLAARGHAVSSSALHRSLTDFNDIVRYMRRAEFLHCALGEKVPFEAALQQVVLMDLSGAITRLANSKATRSKRAR